MEYADIAVLTLGAFSLVAIITMGYCGARIERKYHELIDDYNTKVEVIDILKAELEQEREWRAEGK